MILVLNAMMIVGMLIKCATPLNHHEWDQRKEKKKIRKMHTTSPMWYIAIMAKLDLCHYTLPKWFETITTLNLTHKEPKLVTLGQRKRKEKKNMKLTYVLMANFAKP
jgi:hypothetical protein